ncbi:unnamed protein product, partial [Ixodes persulcatus]
FRASGSQSGRVKKATVARAAPKRQAGTCRGGPPDQAAPLALLTREPFWPQSQQGRGCGRNSRVPKGRPHRIPRSATPRRGQGKAKNEPLTLGRPTLSPGRRAPIPRGERHKRRRPTEREVELEPRRPDRRAPRESPSKARALAFRCRNAEIERRHSLDTRAGSASGLRVQLRRTLDAALGLAQFERNENKGRRIVRPALDGAEATRRERVGASAIGHGAGHRCALSDIVGPPPPPRARRMHVQRPPAVQG